MSEAGRGHGAESDRTLHCLVYVPNIYNGGGTTQTLVWIVEHFERAGIKPVLCFERTWQFPRKVPSVSMFPRLLRFFPGRWTGLVPKYFIERAFLRRLSRHSPSDTIVYIWPQPRLALVQAIKSRGFCIIRELINCPGKVCVTEVRKARRNAGLRDRQLSSDQAILEEFKHFQLCDYLTAPNAEVERALLASGFPSSKIVPTSFGWDPERLSGLPQRSQSGRQSERRKDRPFTVLFVGHLDARKGVHYLLQAWRGMPPAMRLKLVGTVDPEMAPLVERAQADERIAHIPFTKHLGPIFRSADVFAFPSVEEGGPQVTLEAAGCGLPVITTPMGAARLISDGRNGLIVPAHDVPALQAALLDLYESPGRRAALGQQAELDAQAYTYENVGASRALLFRQKFLEYLKASRA